jgi:NAD(P)H-dependent FMN reductase
MATKIAGNADRLRRGSFNRMLQVAAQVLPPDVELAIFDVLDHVPPFNEDWEADPAPVAAAQLPQLIDGLILGRADPGRTPSS